MNEQMNVCGLNYTGANIQGCKLGWGMNKKERKNPQGFLLFDIQNLRKFIQAKCKALVEIGCLGIEIVRELVSIRKIQILLIQIVMHSFTYLKKKHVLKIPTMHCRLC